MKRLLAAEDAGVDPARSDGHPAPVVPAAKGEIARPIEPSFHGLVPR
jgi:hypothetical protein